MAALIVVILLFPWLFWADYKLNEFITKNLERPTQGERARETESGTPSQRPCALYIHVNTSMHSDRKAWNSSTKYNDWDYRDTSAFWYRALEHHPMRTHDPTEADLFFIPLKEAMSGDFDFSFVRTNGAKSNHIAVCNQPYRHCPRGAFRAENINKLTIEIQDKVPWYQGAVFKVQKGWYEIPYPQSYLEQPAYPLEDNLEFQERFRHKLIGSVFGPRDFAELSGKLRTILADECRRNGDIDESTREQICSHSDTTSDAAGYMDLYRDSVFTLQPIGDSYTRGAIWDSLVMGAIPVIFHENSLMHLHSDMFEWDAEMEPIHIQLDLQKVIDGEVDVIETIRNIPRQQIETLQNNIKRFVHRFSYYDFNYRHDVSNREKDAIDWVLDYFCSAFNEGQ